MGVLVKYTCKKCGVIADEVFVGPGFVAINEVFLCKDCNNVMSRVMDMKTGKIKEEYSHCPYCNSTNLVMWDHVCPKCNQTEAEDEVVGFWD